MLGQFQLCKDCDHVTHHNNGANKQDFRIFKHPRIFFAVIAPTGIYLNADTWERVNVLGNICQLGSNKPAFWTDMCLGYD